MQRYRWLRVGSAAALALLVGQVAPAQDISPADPDPGHRIYETACSSCHYRGDARVPFGAQSPQMDSTPDDLLQVILYGRSPKEGTIGMPAFAPALTDADLTALVTYLRAEVKPASPWTDLQTSITQIRKTGSRNDD